MVARGRLLVTSCSRCVKRAVSGVKGERKEELDEAKDRVESMEERTPADRFFLGEVEPKMALVAILGRTNSSNASWS